MCEQREAVCCHRGTYVSEVFGADVCVAARIVAVLMDVVSSVMTPWLASLSGDAWLTLKKASSDTACPRRRPGREAEERTKMAPHLTTAASALFLLPEDCSPPPAREAAAAAPRTEPPPPGYEWRIVWRNVLGFVYLHAGALYGVYLIFTSARLATVLWAVLVAMLGAVGVTAGAHRLWCHRAYKAKWPLRLLLAVLQTMAFQNHIYEWVRDHRVHHKFSDTDADPHNSKRGFFFSHMGWLMLRKHPAVKERGSTVDMSDLDTDPIVVWQRRTYLVVMPLLCFVLPAWLPVRLWGEEPWTAWYVAAIFRYMLSLHITWLVNSAAHVWGTRPFDKNISATENLPVALAAFGEGWHNYHHAFPWDYKAAELGDYRANLSTAFIDLFARLGWAYELRTVPPEMAARRARRTGDGSHRLQGGAPGVSDRGDSLWGWGDRDMPAEEVLEVRLFADKRE
ncbi:acyl-CoA Delta-9 desaturase-like [Bacillus rossius redtenbacheri]|uniref:acyl-CoA Delta-9 desaturase-like n=1 Tax=Bacillus rossius redtenbacheri TaxID=93214 RepID=UPI002FDEAF0C